MEEDEEPVASIAAAKPGVLVNAPAINPTTLGVSMSNKYLEAIPVSAAVATINNVIIASTFPFALKEVKNPGPACIPIVKINSTSPKFPSSFGIITPK